MADTSLRDAVHAYPACAEALAAKDCDMLASIMNAGSTRTRSSGAMIGNGTVLEMLGVADGNAFLDVINNNADFRYVKPLLEQGRLEIGSALVQATVQSLVPTAISVDNANKLCALGKAPWPYTSAELHEALFNADGSEK
jgi:hypothetical protein